MGLADEAPFRHMKRPFGIAMVGLGMAAKPHAKALQELSSKLSVRGVYARDHALREKFAKTYGFPPADDINQLAEDPGLDILLLLTPPNARREYVQLFAGAGKHIISEKPLERELQAATEIVDICQDAGVKLGVVFQHRFRAASRALAGLLEEGRLGKIAIVRINVPWWREQHYYDEAGRGSYQRDGGGVLISQAIHTLDLMLALAGPVASVQAHCATTLLHQMEAEDFAAGSIEFCSGARGAFFASTACFPGDSESLILDCSLASAQIKSGILTVKWHDGRSETFGEEASTGDGADPMDFPHEWHKSLIEDFADAVAFDRSSRVTGHDALAVQRLIGAMEISSHEGRKVALI